MELSSDLHLAIWAIALVLQFAAFLIAVYALQFSGLRSGWLLIAAATFAMGVVRCMVFVRIWMEPVTYSPSLATGLTTLAISVLLLAGLGLGFPAVSKLDRRLAAADAAQTAMRASEDSLRASEAKYRALIESTGTGYVILDSVGKVKECNEEYIRLTGREDSQEVVGHNIAEWYESDLGPDYFDREIVKYVDGEGVEHFGGKFRRPDDTVIPVDFRSCALELEGEFSVIVLVNDASQRLEAENIAKENTEKYRALIDITDTGYIILDPDGNVLDCNETYVRLTGRKSAEEVIGHNLAEWVIHSNPQYVAQEMVKVGGNQRLTHHGVSYKRPDGTTVPVEIYSHALETRSGRQVMALVRD
ncbi:MAG: hypothetical protein COC20_07630, partial [Cellvibrionales bacterium]